MLNNVPLNYCSLIANKPQHRIGSTVSFVISCFSFSVSAASSSDRTNQNAVERWFKHKGRRKNEIKGLFVVESIGNINCGLTNQTYTYLCVFMYIKCKNVLLYLPLCQSIYAISVGLHFQRGRHFLEAYKVTFTQTQRFMLYQSIMSVMDISTLYAYSPPQVWGERPFICLDVYIICNKNLFYNFFSYSCAPSLSNKNKYFWSLYRLRSCNIIFTMFNIVFQLILSHIKVFKCLH